MAGMYAVYHGKNGLIEIGDKINGLTKILDEKLKLLGLDQLNDTYFDTLHFKYPVEKVTRLKLAK